MKVVALSGGVGGARFLDGISGPEVTAIVNTGDDFVHLGLAICPDLDTVMYTLSGRGDEERGWGLKDESFRAMDTVRAYGGADWFALGDRDLGTHLVRTDALKSGASLTEVTARLCRGIAARILPMTDGPCRTMIETPEGTLPFQDWFVRLRAQLEVRAVRFEGRPPPAPGVLEAIAESELVLIGPSNPYVSIDPILSLDGVREALAKKPVVAVSPIVGGKAVKGPLGTMIPQLTGQPASAAAVARHYGALLTAMVVERGDEIDGVRCYATDTIMKSREDRRRLGREVLAFAAGIAAAI
jgi:LPPG:FO 2-phospho-L-lactate transferase